MAEWGPVSPTLLLAPSPIIREDTSEEALLAQTHHKSSVQGFSSCCANYNRLKISPIKYNYFLKYTERLAELDERHVCADGLRPWQ